MISWSGPAQTACVSSSLLNFWSEIYKSTSYLTLCNLVTSIYPFLSLVSSFRLVLTTLLFASNALVLQVHFAEPVDRVLSDLGGVDG
jgi:hypothetical protein